MFAIVLFESMDFPEFTEVTELNLTFALKHSSLSGEKHYARKKALPKLPADRSVAER